MKNQTEELQSKVLQKLIHQAIHTEWGQTHGFAQVNDYNSFTKTSPISTYEELKGYIDRMRRGEKDVLWSGKVRWYAKSSGTTNDKKVNLFRSVKNACKTHITAAERMP